MKLKFWTSAVKETPALRECDFSVSPLGLSTISDVLGYYDRIRDYIQHEDDLINSRLTWSLTVHGFLFTIYGILLDKISTHILALQDNPDSSATMERAIAWLFVAQIPIALFGAIVGFLSREAIVAGHNAIQHLFAISQASDALRTFTTQTEATDAIAKGRCTVTPVDISGIVQGSLLLVDDQSACNEEIVSVLSAGNGSFEANFERSHLARAIIKPLGQNPVMLPKVIAGGDKGGQTGGARRYYVGLPVCTMAAWTVLLSVSLIFGWVFYWNLF
jgi:uncharacterized protein with PQ loop repeat